MPALFIPQQPYSSVYAVREPGYGGMCRNDRLGRGADFPG